jgi:hypothetical protein
VLYRDGPRMMAYNVSLQGYTGLRELPEYQNIISSYSQFLSLEGSLQYSNLRTSLGAVDYEKGYSWRLAFTSRYVKRKVFARYYGTLDFGFALPLSHSSVWLRSAGGFSPHDPAEPLANFYFGGFGNNWVDHASAKRYRAWYSFPGLELNEVGGVNFARTMLEWNLPPLRFRRTGISMLYLTWARMSLFASSIVLNIEDDITRETLGNIGAQLDLRMQLLSHLRMTLSFGYARAFEKGWAPDDEFMISLKIL